MLAISKYLDLEMTGAVVSPELERRFACAVKMSDGTFRTTARRRLEAVDRLFFQLWRVQADRVLDIGVSFGITTLEWLHGFHERGLHPAMSAVDKTATIDIMHLPLGIKIYTETDSDHILQIEIAAIGIRTAIRRRDFITGSALPRLILIALARLALRGNFPKGRTMFAPPDVRQSLRVYQDNILDPDFTRKHGNMDVVRVANLMQPVYFPPDKLRFMAEQIAACCRGAGSMVILCQEHHGRLDASILKMLPDRSFEIAGTLGQGSAVRQYFL